MYASEYESSSVGPLVNVLQSLDEERVTQHLQEMNLRITKGNTILCEIIPKLLVSWLSDPQQLPATVLSSVANKYLYHCSVFKRLQRAGHPVVMLKEQYRMHPEICCFPSLPFYDKQLLNGDQMASRKATFHETGGLGPSCFLKLSRTSWEELRWYVPL